MQKGDELRARRLARQIASIGMLSERITAIINFGNARFQEGYEAANDEEGPGEPPVMPNTDQT